MEKKMLRQQKSQKNIIFITMQYQESEQSFQTYFTLYVSNYDHLQTAQILDLLLQEKVFLSWKSQSVRVFLIFLKLFINITLQIITKQIVSREQTQDLRFYYFFIKIFLQQFISAQMSIISNRFSFLQNIIPIDLHLKKNETKSIQFFIVLLPCCQIVEINPNHNTKFRVKEALMLNFQKNVPIKETYNYLAKFPRFSLIQKIPPRFFPTSSEASICVANIIKDEIIQKNSMGKTCVLGLATGSTPLGLYRQLIRMHKNGQLSFKNVVTFNLDEYFPIQKKDHESYNYQMDCNLFNHIDIPRENINVPNGEITRDNVTNFCLQYEKKISSYGGIDIQILGIGRTGHIGFNEPPSPIKSITRLVYLHRLTRKDAASSFGGIQKVPKCAISMGIDTIKKAKKIIIMAWGEAKADIVKQTIEGQPNNPKIPSTFLHDHPDITFFLDKTAGQKLTRFNTPWVIKGDLEDPIVPKNSYWVLKSVLWLSLKLNKPILRLTYDDYEDFNLSQLVMQCAHGSVEDLNLYAYRKIISRITGWPLRPKKQGPGEIPQDSIIKTAEIKEKILIFSPHPDDDVISMGGTLKKLHDQGHQVHVAYMTSGSNGVYDLEARKYLYFLKDFSNEYLWNLSKIKDNKTFICEYNRILDEADKVFDLQRQEDRKTELNTTLKKIIRSSQAKIALNFLGLPASRAYSLQLPFYSNKVPKIKQAGEEDLEIIRSLLRLIEPTTVFAAGDLADPHGTHRKCLELLITLHEQQHEKAQKDPSYKPLLPPAQKFLLYRGAWQQWSITMSRIIVPMSPKDVENKMMSIWKHQSQKDGPMFLGEDKREFWQRAKERNRKTAQKLNILGFSDYQACECFVNLNDLKNYDQI